MTPAISSFTAPVAPSAPSQPTASASQPNTSNGFAKLLSQRQAMAAHEPVPANKTAPAEKPASTQAQAAPQNTNAPTNKAAGHDRQAAKADKPKSPANSAADKADDAKAADKSTSQAEEQRADRPDAGRLDVHTEPAACDTRRRGPGCRRQRGSLLEAAGADSGKAGRAVAKGLPAATGDAAAGINTGTATSARGATANDTTERLRAGRDGRDAAAAAQPDAQAQSGLASRRLRARGEPEEAKPRNEIGATGAVGAAASTPLAKAAETAAPTV